jgi:hypothetical protein
MLRPSILLSIAYILVQAVLKQTPAIHVYIVSITMFSKSEYGINIVHCTGRCILYIVNVQHPPILRYLQYGHVFRAFFLGVHGTECGRVKNVIIKKLQVLVNL